MKTTVFLPDDLFLQVRAMAKKLRVSRSQLIAKAIAELLERARAESVTDRLNEIYSGNRANLDPALHRAQLESLDKDS
jgi:predicted transcriptional regulator